VNEDKSKLPHLPNGVSPASSDDQAGWINGTRGWTGWVQATPEEMAANAAKPVKVLEHEDLVELARPGGEPPTLYPTKSAKRTFIEFTPADWTPLQEAFARMIAVLGSSFVAERDLRNDLLAGRLVAAVRWCTSEDDWEGCEQLKPAAWQATYIGARLWPHDAMIEVYPGPRQSKHSPGRLWRGHSLDFYIARASLEERYPLLEETSPTPTLPAAKPEPETPRRLQGRHPVHEHHVIVTEIVLRCHASGRLVVPEDEAIFAEQLVHWYVTEERRQIHPSTMREIVRTVCAHLRKKLETPETTKPRKPSR
jgi:hypothetical protein